MATSLPNNPSLDRFGRDARRLQRAVRADVPRAVRIVERLHPEGVPADRSGFTLASAKLVVARGYGFASRPRLKHYLKLPAELRRDPVDARARDDAQRFCVLACLRTPPPTTPTVGPGRPLSLPYNRICQNGASTPRPRPATRTPS